MLARIRLSIGLLSLVCFSHFLFADDKHQPHTLMTEPGKQLLSFDLSKPFPAEWKVAKGKWEVVNGAMQVKELKTDMHGAVARTPLKFTNAVVQFDFKLDGAKNCSFSINDATGHVCRVMFNSTGFSVNKDKHDKKDDNDKQAILERKSIDIKPDTWHTMVIELLGNELIATLDGKTTAIGKHPFLDRPKTNIGLTVAGESASYRNLMIWEAIAKSDWEKTKAKLQQVTK